MTSKNHNISLEIDGQTAELFSPDELNLRMNSVFIDPSQIRTASGEYSFTFELPITPTNSRIFGHIENLAKTNKFSKNHNCTVICDGSTIFEGTLKVSEVSRSGYKCNLVSIKVNTLEDIFGEDTLSQLTWYVPFIGVSTINETNENNSSDHYFPLVSYGCFQKRPKEEYENALSVYTPKHTIDEYNRFYLESFSPSLKLTELVKKLFNAKGYTVGGDIFNDSNADNIYLSTSIKEDQHPTYNIGNDRLGHVLVNFSYTNSGVSEASRPALSQTLAYPKEDLDGTYNNFDTVYNYDIFTCADSNGYVSSSNTYMFRDNMIVIPADGLYKITLNSRVSINDASGMTVYKYGFEGSRYENNVVGKQETLSKNFTNYPIELQVVRNEDDVELIYGVSEDKTMYPHEMGWVSRPSTGRTSNRNPNYVGGGIHSRASTDTASPQYVALNGETVCYDPKANPNFICGISTISNSAAFIKNGVSWSSDSTDSNISRYRCNGYKNMTRELGSVPNGDGTYRRGYVYSYTPSNYNYNTLLGLRTSDGFTVTDDYNKQGSAQFIIKLNRNDILMLKAVTRRYMKSDPFGDSDTQYGDYTFKVNGTLAVEAYTPKAERYADDTTLSWYSIPMAEQFDTELNLGQFLSVDTKQKDFIQNFMDAFNLSYKQEGKTVTLDKQKKDFGRFKGFIDLDDRVSSDEATTERIPYPYTMKVEYSIDDSERGFYISVPSDKVEQDDWKDYAFTGSDEIILGNDEDDGKETLQLDHSYTWYEDFTLADGTVLSLPVISKDEYLIEGYKYEDAMKHDGKGLKQRWWYRQPTNGKTLTLWDGSTYNITIPTNEMDGHVLDYTTKEGSLLTEYFNISTTPESNLVRISAYLSPMEYNLLRNGSMVRFDDDLYIVTELVGYDCSGNNPTEIVMMKKV